MSWPEHQYQNQSKPDIVPHDGRERDWDDQRRRQWDAYDSSGMHPATFRRSRTPPEEEGARKRRRSPSPWDRGRYEPRPRYGDERDVRVSRDDFIPNRRGSYHSHGGRDSRRMPPANPYEQDYPAQLRHFAEWFRWAYPDQATEEDRLDLDAHREAGLDGPKPRDGIRARWEKYKKDFAITQVTIMFDYHKKSPWFAERYDPSDELVRLRRRVRKEGWKGRASQFLLELEEGKHDSETNFGSPPPFNEPVSPVLETPSKLENPPLGEDSAKPTDEDMPFGMEAEDDAPEADTKTDIVGNNKQIPRSRADDTISVMPEGNEVMIRTIPPDIGRIKLEEACSSVSGFMHLALGEPLQKRNFYRAGWIKMRDDTDMEKAVQELGEKKLDGFKLHVTHTTRPFVTKMRITPDAASRPERLAKDLAQVKRLVAVLESEAASLRSFSPTAASKAAAMNGQNDNQSSHEGDNKPEQAKAEESESVSMNGRSDQDVEAEVETEPQENGSVIVERRINKLISELEEQSPGDLDGGLGWEAKKVTIALDLYLAYIRAAFNTCYYCAAVTDHVEELQRKCVKHVRKPLSQKALEEIATSKSKKTVDEDMGMETKVEPQEDEQGESVEGEKQREKQGEVREWKRNDEKWLDWLDGRIALLIDRSSVDPREYGGKDEEEELTKACEMHIKQEDEGKFRCKQCNKLFKAMAFVEKHVANKHPELIKHLDELSYYNNFALDPQRIQPLTHAPPQAGNSNGPPPQAYGLKATHWPRPAGSDYGHQRGLYPPYSSMPLPPTSYGGYPPPPPYHEPWGYASYPPVYPHPMTEATTMGGGMGGGRRLSERLGGFVDLPSNVEGLPPKPPGTGRAPPPDVREDPRAAGGRKISYHDIDKTAAGDDVNIELSY